MTPVRAGAHHGGEGMTKSGSYGDSNKKLKVHIFKGNHKLGRPTGKWHKPFYSRNKPEPPKASQGAPKTGLFKYNLWGHSHSKHFGMSI